MTLSLLKDYAMKFVGTPYHWGGDDPIEGYDCSGFVQELLMAAGIDPRGDQTAQLLYDYFLFRGKKNRSLGSLAFFGKNPDSITHVAFLLDYSTMIEAGGGRSSTTSELVAAKQNAYIRLRPVNSRKDLIDCILPIYLF